ncbi:hypothetical protein [Actinotalea fermentans]|uniref:Uncharacterized protein n=1 Tax=Actinotalea fermentans TaxID=43671 RepID=A0A511YW27_9CELL|nr:hypothetical protein [Actinotalea fermentans]KGM16640.1 hypothetical protein N867_17975 [Actinotalea fermentans ATCC 43279 = JCM 9966 = DSM 3133]GEN79424.1 hypothetical protein AFE02nite_11580 [Actinotalea fermentans]
MSGTGAPERRGGPSLSPTGQRTFLVVDAILVVTFAVLLVLHLVNSAAAPSTPAAAATPTPTSSAAPETTPEATAPSAPADNAALAEFVLPSGNIWCSMTQTSATCVIGQFSFAPPTPPPGCTGTVGPVFTVTAADGAAQPCVPEVPPRPDDAPVLEYGQASTIGEMTCYSSRNGATCRHNPTGEGFSVARAGYTTL